jgi:hypothetical protein
MEGVFYHRHLHKWCSRNSCGDIVVLHANKTAAEAIIYERGADSIGTPEPPARSGTVVNIQVNPPPEVPTVFYEFTPQVKVSIPAVSGVYVAVDANLRCKYVGKSKNLRSRLLEKHHGINRKEDKIAWIEVPEERLNEVECYLIGMLSPYNNFVTKPQHRHKNSSF